LQRDKQLKMDITQYNHLFNYLQNQILPVDLTPTQQQKLVKQSRYFEIKNNYLYKHVRQKLLRVIRSHEMEAVLYMMHNDPTAGHFAVDIMFDKIKERYYWPQLYENIREYVRSCDSCQRRGKPKKHEELHPIPVQAPFYQIGIDFVGPLPITTNGNKYIIVAVDYFTKWPEAKAVPEATAEQVALFIYEHIICHHGCPKKILSDRGTHFNNQMIKELMNKFKIKHLLSTPYHPQTNGLVERFNRTLCESLAKTAQDLDNWDLQIAPTLFAYRTSKHSITKISPFYLVHGRNATLPLNDLDDQNVTLSKHLQNLVDQLPQTREIARNRIATSQHNQKNRHDRQIDHLYQFEIGDKVLYYDAAKDKQWSGKLNPKWKGPYYIHQVLINGSYKIREIDGRVLRTPANGNLLKPYHDRQNWEPQIVI